MSKTSDIDTILTGDPVEAMEAAKRLISKNERRQIDRLMSIAAHRHNPLWSRIAAIYTLGFIDEAAVSLNTLRSLAYDRTEHALVIEHAREAMDNLSYE
jgi:hypothetical protein